MPDHGKPYGSRNVGHVPPPDPATWWDFQPGQSRTILVQPFVAFRVDLITPDPPGPVVEGELHIINNKGEKRIKGELWLDRPVVCLRVCGTGEPMITLTLRNIVGGKAYLQVSGHPRCKEVRRV